MPVRGITAQKEPRAVSIVKKTIAHDHVIAVSLEVESLPVSTTQANGNEAPFTILEDPVLAPKEHRASHAIEGTKATSNIESDAVSHNSGVHASDALLPLKSLLEEATVEDQILEVVNIGGVLVEVVRTVSPKPGSQSPKDAVLDRDVRHHDALVTLMRKEANTQTDLTLGIILVMLVLQGIVKIAVLDPEVLPRFSVIGIVCINPGHAAVEFDPHDLESSLIGKTNARSILIVILPIDHGLRAHSVS